MLKTLPLPCNKLWHFFISILVCIIFFSFGVFLSNTFCEEASSEIDFSNGFDYRNIFWDNRPTEIILSEETPLEETPPVILEAPPEPEQLKQASKPKEQNQETLVEKPLESNQESSKSSTDNQGVLNKRKDCWYECNNSAGLCDFCGTGKCCRMNRTEADVCRGESGCRFKHCCVPQDPEDSKFEKTQEQLNPTDKPVKEVVEAKVICQDIDCPENTRKVDEDDDGCVDLCEPCEKFTCESPLVPADSDLDGCKDFCRVKLLNLKLNFVGPTETFEQENYIGIGMEGEVEGIKIWATGFDRVFTDLGISVVAGWYGRKWKPVMRGALQGVGSCDGIVNIAGLEAGKRYWVKTWHHNLDGQETKFTIQWNEGEEFMKRHTTKPRHCNKITQHVQDIVALEDGSSQVRIKSVVPVEGAQFPEGVVYCSLNALEIKQYCYGDETCLPHERCSSGVCHRDLTKEFSHNRKKNKIGVIGVWLGWEWPLYLNLTFESFRQNSDMFDFYILSNMTTDHYIPPDSSIHFAHVTRRDFFERFAFITDDEKRAYRNFPGKFVNDLKHVFPILFPDILETYDYWGWIDLDLIIGDVSSWLTFDKDLDVVSFSEGYFKTVHLRGQFSIFRNIPHISNKWKGDECYPHLELELKHMYNRAFNKPMHKNDEGCFSWSLMNDPKVNVRLYPYQIHDHHVRSIHYGRGKAFACNARRQEDCKELVQKYLNMLKEEKCASSPKFTTQGKATWRGELKNEVGTGLRDKRCMTWVPSPFRISCVNISNQELARSDYYKMDYLVESQSDIKDVSVTRGEFSDCIGDGSHLREVMLAHWKKFKPLLTSHQVFRPLGHNEVLSINRDVFEIYTIDDL